MLDLRVRVAVNQGDLECALQHNFPDKPYNEIESELYALGFYQGNGSVSISLQWPPDEESEVSKAILQWMEENNYGSVMFYEDY